MSELSCDVVVVGLGPGGESLAAGLAKAGLDVIGVEAELVGGECPYWGCIPSKMAIRAANLLAEARRIDGMAGSATVTPDFGVVAQRIRDEATDNWDDTVAVKRLEDSGARFIRGKGRIVGERRVEVGGQTIEARKGVVLNTGTRAMIPPIDGLSETPYWTNREALEAKAAPVSMVVMGGGSIGLELAQMFSRFGTEVTVVEAGPRILGPEEPESADLIAKVFTDEGIALHADAKVTRVSHDGTRFTVTFGGTDVSAERLLVAAGRESRIDGIGLEDVGVDASGRFVGVDEHQHVNEWLWAIGDITGKGAFTHISMYQAAIAQRSILGEGGPGADYSALSRVTFTDPEVGAVGMTEQQAREAGINVRTSSTGIPESSRGFIHRAGNEGFIKLVIDDDRGILVGATSAGPTGGETLSALAMAVHAQIPLESLRHAIWAYPTFWRAIESAL
ncbi:MAG TPA: NAD(P)/FAD-dependent oxidoreductase [Aeromicrobium sp.]|nr:NAD(P)/FAD-dependent oxidoreductase [Aeromicrobium sp.]